ncbi:MAG: hypothetical protein ACI8RL_002099, partial [Cyclobacteriaceae bacterium]
LIIRLSNADLEKLHEGLMMYERLEIIRLFFQ